MACEPGDDVKYTAPPIFDMLIRTGDVGRVTKAADGLVWATWPTGVRAVPVTHVRRIRRIPRSRRIDELITYLRSQRDTVLEPGLSTTELDRAEAEFGLTFPPLWRDLLGRAHPVDVDLGAPEARRCPESWYPDWRLREVQRTHELVETPIRAVADSAGRDGFWYDAWGPRPDDAAGRAAIAGEHLARAGRLVPLLGRLYVAATDSSPIFSIRPGGVEISAVGVAHLPVCGYPGVAQWSQQHANEVGVWTAWHAYLTQRPRREPRR